MDWLIEYVWIPRIVIVVTGALLWCRDVRYLWRHFHTEPLRQALEDRDQALLALAATVERIPHRTVDVRDGRIHVTDRL
jgi:hypothetical protein